MQLDVSIEKKAIRFNHVPDPETFPADIMYSLMWRICMCCRKCKILQSGIAAKKNMFCLFWGLFSGIPKTSPPPPEKQCFLLLCFVWRIRMCCRKCKIIQSGKKNITVCSLKNCFFFWCDLFLLRVFGISRRGSRNHNPNLSTAL